jgi:hypothetical protein
LELHVTAVPELYRTTPMGFLKPHEECTQIPRGLRKAMKIVKHFVTDKRKLTNKI